MLCTCSLAAGRHGSIDRHTTIRPVSTFLGAVEDHDEAAIKPVQPGDYQEIGLSRATFRTELMPHQIAGVRWMCNREKRTHGGIMMDGLGMGKTVQMLTLCYARHRALKNDLDAAAPKAKGSSTRGASKAEAGATTTPAAKSTKRAPKKHDNEGADDVGDKASLNMTPAAVVGVASRLLVITRQLSKIQSIGSVSRITRPGRDLLHLQQLFAAVVAYFSPSTDDSSSSATASPPNQFLTEAAGIFLFDASQPAASAAAAADAQLYDRLVNELEPWLQFTDKYHPHFVRSCRVFISQATQSTQENYKNIAPGDHSAFSQLRHDRVNTIEGDELALMQTPEMRTLIVVPASLLHQWPGELENRFNTCLENPVHVLMLHDGNRKKLSKPELESADLVMVTYDTVAMLYAQAMRYYNPRSGLFLAEPQAVSYNSTGRKTRMWARHEHHHAAGRASHDHAKKKVEFASALEDGIVHPLFTIRWKRIIVDEAHVIRNPMSLRHRAVMALSGMKRWAVTATPLHNSIEDVQSLLQFTGNSTIPLMKQQEEAISRDVIVQRSLAIALKPTCLRRLPSSVINGKRVVIVALPPKYEETASVALSAEAIEEYNVTLMHLKRSVALLSPSNGGKLQGGSPGSGGGGGLLRRPNHHNSSVIEWLAILSRMRLLCCHPWLAEHESVSNVACSICRFAATHPVVAPCGHAFCKSCLQARFVYEEAPTNANGTTNKGEGQLSAGSGAVMRTPCPECHTPISISVLKTHVVTSQQRRNAFKSRTWRSSAKVDALLTKIRDVLENHAGEKIVVFSQYVMFLDIIEIALERENLQFFRMDGSTRIVDRLPLLDRFQKSKECHILLASKMAMGQGLNITMANHCFVVDPWWNPAVEEQAVHRTHRIGQTKPVHVTRFVTKQTVEEYCHNVAERKKKLQGTVLGIAQTTKEAHVGVEFGSANAAEEAESGDIEGGVGMHMVLKMMEVCQPLLVPGAVAATAGSAFPTTPSLAAASQTASAAVGGGSGSSQRAATSTGAAPTVSSSDPPVRISGTSILQRVMR